MKSKRLNLINKTIAILGIILMLSIIVIPHVRAQFYPPPPLGLSFFGFPILPPIPPQPFLPPLRYQAIPLASLTPLTVTVPQVTAAGLTVTSLVPSLAPAALPTLSVLVNVTAGTLLPTTFLFPFPLTAAVAPTLLPTVTTTVALPAAAPTLTSLIALALGGGLPGIGGGTTLLSTLPLPVPTTTLPFINIPTGVVPTAIPII
jgi:hypothetical protein